MEQRYPPPQLDKGIRGLRPTPKTFLNPETDHKREMGSQLKNDVMEEPNVAQITVTRPPFQNLDYMTWNSSYSTVEKGQKDLAGW